MEQRRFIRLRKLTESWISVLPVCLVFGLLFFGCTTNQPDPQNSANEIIQSSTDSRSYRSLLLDNRLQVLLISDPDADQAAAAMDVAVGQFSDPQDRQGLAHFLEHMLFLGTDKYPDAGEYGNYLSAHGGYSNAFTSLQDTNFFFSIHKDYLEGALDRFSQFFISPRFDARFADREINAVNSEHQKNLKNDERRIYQVLRNTSNPKHPFHKFGTGNLQTLLRGKGGDGELREQLIQFYKGHYSSNLMKLVILGKESPDELEKMARQYFAAIPDRDIQPERFTDQPVLQQPIGRKITIQPVKSMRQLRLMFPIPAQRDHYSSKAASIISGLLGDEGKGSILALLRKEGLATALSAGAGPESREFAFITLTINLTPIGLEQTDQIIGTVFQYVQKLQQEDSLERYFHEARKIAAVDFQFREKEEAANYASRLAMKMQDVPMQHVLVAPWLYESYRPDLFQQILERLTPDNLQIVLIAENLPADETDPWYGTRYGINGIPRKKLTQWSTPKPNPELFLPPPNPFIADDVRLFREPAKTEYPALIQNSDLIRVWFKKDDVFNLPKGNIRIRLSTTDAYATVENAAKTRLFTQLLTERLNEYSYPASVAGLHYSIQNSVKGIEFALSGYSDNLDILFRKVVDEIREFKVDKERFRIIRNKMIEDRRNMKLSQAYHRVGYETYYLLSTPFWHTDQYLEVLDGITVVDLEAFLPKLFSGMHIEFLAYGNFKEGSVNELANYLQQQLGTSGSPVRPVEQTLYIPDGESFVYQFQTPDVNSAIELYYQAGPETIRQSVAMAVLQQIIEKPFYHQLRTLEQLGYIVWSGYREFAKVDGFVFIIQSNVKDPVYLQSRIEDFIRTFEQQLEKLPEDEFVQFKEAVIAKRRESPKNLQEETLRYWETISSGEFDFERREKEIAELESLSLQEVQQLFQRVFINPETMGRMSVQAVGSAHESRSPEGLLIENPRLFKKAREYYPNPEAKIGN